MDALAYGIIGLVVMSLVLIVFELIATSLVGFKLTPRRYKRTLGWMLFFYIVLCLFNYLFIPIHMVREERKMPVVVETISEPQVDTLVVGTLGDELDTTYVYTFPNIVIE
jgi:hypothetical protein